jgi:hypothetical protein
VLPIRATAEMVAVKLVEQNWPTLEPEIAVALQVSPFLLWVGLRCLGHCVHGAPIGKL